MVDADVALTVASFVRLDRSNFSSWAVDFVAFLTGSSEIEASRSASEIESERRRLCEWVDTLPALDREVLALRHIEKLSAEEAADALALDTGAARPAYLVALRHLGVAIAEGVGFEPGRARS